MPQEELLSPTEVDSASREEWLRKHLNLSPEQLEEAIVHQQAKFGGLLARENAIELIARGHQLPEVKAAAPVFSTLLQAAGKLVGQQASVRARVWHAYCPKRFVRKTERGEREGRVANVEVRDASGSAVLVLWNKDVELLDSGQFVRNAVVEIVNANVKSVTPLELHAGLLTQILVKSDGQIAPELLASLPAHEKKNTPLKEVADGMLDVDAGVRIVSLGKLNEFSRTGKTGAPEKGWVCDALVTDGTASLRLVGWDENARTLSLARVGEAIRIESGYVKKDAGSGGLELQVGWRGRIARTASGASAAPAATSFWETTYPKILLSELAEGKPHIVTAKVVELRGARKLLKCSSCGTRMEPGITACPECGVMKLRMLLIVRTVLDDGTANIPTTFFDQQALELLELKELTIDAQTALDVKKNYLLGREISVVLSARKNPLDGGLEATVKHVVSMNPSPAGEIAFLNERIARKDGRAGS